jgi:hypothetical protein
MELFGGGTSQRERPGSLGLRVVWVVMIERCGLVDRSAHRG